MTNASSFYKKQGLCVSTTFLLSGWKFTRKTYYRLLTSVATFLNSPFLCSLSIHFSVIKTSNIFYKVSVLHSCFKLKYSVSVCSIGKQHPILILTRIDPNRALLLIEILLRLILCVGYLTSRQQMYIYIYGWGSRLTMAFIGNFVYMAHHFIVLRLIPFFLRDDRKDGGLSTLRHSCRIG